MVHEAEQVERLAVDPDETVRQFEPAVRSQYAGSTDRDLDALFQKPSWTIEDVILLQACSRTYLRTHSDLFEEARKAASR